MQTSAGKTFIPPKTFSILIAMLILLASSGCSFNNPNHAPSGPVFRIRWFPAEHAVAYRLSVKDPNTSTEIEQITIRPQGCTHLANEGFTSGLCIYDYKLPSTQKAAIFVLESINQKGTSSKQAAAVRLITSP